MSHALEGTPKPGMTLTEQANSQRLPRSMFIGHSVGYLLLLLVARIVVNGVQFNYGPGGDGMSFVMLKGLSFDSRIDLTSLPPALHIDLLAGNLIGNGVLLAIALFAACDLVIRRRHDRGRSGIDGAMWLFLFAASQVADHFRLLPTDIINWLDAALLLGGLYLFIVLVLLPGNKGDNRYGPKPQPT